MGNFCNSCQDKEDEYLEPLCSVVSEESKEITWTTQPEAYLQKNFPGPTPASGSVEELEYGGFRGDIPLYLPPASPRESAKDLNNWVLLCTGSAPAAEPDALILSKEEEMSYINSGENNEDKFRLFEDIGYILNFLRNSLDKTLFSKITFKEQIKIEISSEIDNICSMAEQIAEERMLGLRHEN